MLYQPGFIEKQNYLLTGDARQQVAHIPSQSINLVVTSPPYYNQRDYRVSGQIGQEQTLEGYLQSLYDVFDECHRILTEDGTLWVVIGDGYATKRFKQPGSDKWLPPQQFGTPFHFVLGMQQRGWLLRTDIIWNKPNAMPSSIKNRPTRSHEYIFAFSKSNRYYFNSEHPLWREERVNDSKITDTEIDDSPIVIPEGKQSALGKSQYTGFNQRWAKRSKGLKTRNRRTVWTVTVKPIKDAHFATYPLDLILPIVAAASPEGGCVFDPFMGSGTTAIAALSLQRYYAGVELNSDYVAIAARRIAREAQLFNKS